MDLRKNSLNNLLDIKSHPENLLVYCLIIYFLIFVRLIGFICNEFYL